MCREPSSSERTVLGRARFALCTGQINDTACFTAHVRLYPAVWCILGLTTLTTRLVRWLGACAVVRQQCKFYVSNVSAQTNGRVATLREKLQIKHCSFIRSQYSDTRPTSPCSDPIMPGVWVWQPLERIVLL